MIPKKTPQADLSNKSVLFFSIGLAASLLLANLAFTYKVYDDTKVKVLTVNTGITEEILEVPATDLPPPPPPQLEQPNIIEVKNDKLIEMDLTINMDVETNVEQQIATVTPIVLPTLEEVKEDPEEIFMVVEESAMPIGGLTAFYDFVKTKLKYPAQARRMNVEGKVFVQFVVEKDGSITDVKTIKGIGAGCDEEAIRVVQSAPHWKPAKQRGKAVRQRMVIPITFKMAR